MRWHATLRLRTGGPSEGLPIHAAPSAQPAPCATYRTYDNPL